MSIDNMISRIGCCIEVILITWLLWKPIDCNRNRVNEGNRTAKIFKQLFNQNRFDPLTALNVSAGNRNSSWIPIPISLNKSSSSQISSSLNSLKLNYLLSLLQNEERQAISGVNAHESQIPKIRANFLVPNQKKDGIVGNNEIELGIEDKRGLHEANKLSLFSSSLNVIDVSPQDTQLAHSVLIVHRPKPNKTVKPTVEPQQQYVTYLSNTIPNKLNSKTPIVTAITTTTESYATPVKNNHRPINSNMPWIGLRAKPSTTTIKTSIISNASTSPLPLTSKIITKTTTPSTTSTVKDTEVFNTTSKTSQVEDEVPVIFNNNHKKTYLNQYPRQKLSTEYALIFTTPSSSTADNLGFSEYSTIYTPSHVSSIRPPYVTPLSHQTSSLVSVVKRPPIKIINVNGNKVKPPEEVYSSGITVLDPPFIGSSSMKLPPNTTIIHKNLIVPMKEGRPKPVFPIQTTTQFPVYPVVAGITKWHTKSPTTSWPYPLITTNSPENYTSQTQTFAYETSSSSFENPVTEPSVNRPTIITSQPIESRPSTHHQSGHSTHLVTVIPIKGSDSSQTASNTFIVTQTVQTPRPSTSTTGYWNAIWAPPMPITRPQPVHQQQIQNSPGGWFSPLSNLFSIDSNSSVFGFLSVLRAVLMTVIVMFLPPLTLAAAFIG